MSDSPEKTDSSEVSTQQTLAANQVAASLNSHIPERHRNWHWNWMLIGCTALITVAGLVFSSVSYLHHSNQAAKSFLTLASEAADRGEIDTQINWRNRYSLMNPDNHEIIIETAIIADNAVEKAARGDRFAAIRTAQKQLSNSIARLDSQKYGSAIDDLRKRLVERLLQLGDFRLKEAESQILKMRANPNDAFVAKQFARAIVGQVLNGIYEPRDPLMKDKETDYWGWMRNQVPGEILTLAVRRNPKDIDLISLFLTAYHDHPQIFEPLDQRDGTDELATLADQLVEEAVTFLLENASSQSNWILYTHYLAENLQEPARNLARKNVKASLDRITEASVSEKENTKPVSSLVPEYFWDIYLVNAAAMSLESEDSQKTIEYYSFLTKLQLEPLPTQAIEISYLRLGSAYLNNQDTEAALESWQKGLIENPNSIPILNAIATFKVAERNDVEAAKEALDALQSAINSRVQFIASKSPAELPDDQRSIAVDKNQVARWQYEVLQASLDQQEGRETEAIERLQRALGTTLKINTPYLVAVANQLADIYAAKDLWDQVATTLDRVSNKDPDNAFLHARIANAWQKAGNLEQANKQWRTIKSEDSLNFRIAAVEAAINQQTQLPPTLRDFRQARAVLSTLRSELEASTAEAPEDNNGEFIETRTRNQAYLDVLAAFIPSVGADIENHLNSGDFVANVIELSERYTDDRDIQIFAAKRLASADRLAESKSALTRLEKIEGPDSTLVEVTKSQIESLQGEWDQAAERLLKQAETDSGRATNLTLRAASYLERGGELEKAYSCLANLPSDSQTIEALARLALLANSIPDNSSILVSLELENPRRVLAENWEKKTRDLEGEKGTTWRMLKIRRLIGELRSARDRIESTDIRLREAKKLNQEILSWRPRWGEAIASTGYLKSIEASTRRRDDPTAVSLREDAVEDLRRGIEAGDRQNSTRYLIVELLGQLQREDEAERELELATYAVDPNFDQYSTMRINLANRRGDFDRGLAMAQAKVDQNPSDYRTHEVLARTAFLIGKASNDTAKRSKMFDLTATEIAEAIKLTEDDQTSLFSLQIEFFGSLADEPQLTGTITQIEESNLARFDKLSLTARAFELLGDDEQTLDVLTIAAKERPSVRVYLSQAAVCRRMGRTGEATQILQKALKIAPNNGDVRFAVASSIIAEGGDKEKPLDWETLAKLMSQNEGATNSNRLQHALVLYAQGESLQKREGIRILRKLINERTETSKDAIRVLAAILRGQLREDEDEDEDIRNAKIIEVRNLYAKLRSNVAPNAKDIYDYANFLLELKMEEDYPQIEQLRDELVKMRVGVIFGLEVGVRYAQLTVAREDFPEEIRKWESEVRRLGLLNADSVTLAAGSSLLQLGRVDMGLGYFENLYENNPKTLSQYFVALVGARRLSDAIELSLQHYKNNHDATSATLFVGGLNRLGETELDEEYAAVVELILKEHENNLELLENIATLRLQHQDSDGAVAIFNRILKVDPVRIRTLNNMAMTLAELPDRVADAMNSVDRAITLAGEQPELLDTKGFVLMKSGDLNEAEKTFRRAFAATNEPRFQFHEILTLLAQDKEEEAEKSFQSLDVKNLNPAGLTLAERKQLETLKLDFRGNE